MLKMAKHRMRRNTSFALLGGLIATVLFWGLSCTTSLHGFSVKAMGPAINLVNLYLDPRYTLGSLRYLEELATNLVLYAFWIFVAWTAVDLIGNLKRKVRSSG
jgi:hypothetical protein